MKRRISATSAQDFATCPRKYYYRHILGWRPVKAEDALTFGTAWHKLMEIGPREGLPQLLDLPETAGMDEYTRAKLAAMATAYADLWRPSETAEQAFEYRLQGTHWRVVGRIDGLNKSIRQVVEYKTTGSDISDGATYWTRLRYNLQVLLYAAISDALEARYVVARKPALRPKDVPVLDDDGLKIVRSLTTGERCYLANGKPAQRSEAGVSELVTTPESSEEYFARVLEDIRGRMDYYFAEREIAIDTASVCEAVNDIVGICREIATCNRNSYRCKTERHAWRRNCTEVNCQFCPFRGLCLDIDYSPENGVPEGFTTTK